MKRGTSRRLASGAYFASAIGLATLLLVMACAIAVRYDPPINSLFGGGRHNPPERIISTLTNISGNVSCTVILPKNNLVYLRLKQMLNDLRDYAKNANTGLSLKIDFLDPHSNLARSADAARRYGATGWCVVFDNGQRFEIVPYDALVETSQASDGDTRAHPVVTRFRGDQVCAAALARLARIESPVVYALSGHGERDFASYDPLSGYSDFARELDREGYLLRPLNTADAGIPEDCGLLVIAGPRFAPDPSEVTAIGDYIDKGGRILMLADRSSAVSTGWAPILARVGMRLSNFIAIDSDTLGGYNLLSDNFGDHDAVKFLKTSAVYFVSPQIIDPAPADASVTAPQVNVVVSAPASAWGESNPDVLPRHYDHDVDRKGTLPLILAAEGPGGADIGLPPFRAFVIGDSNFAANTLLAGGTTANRDLLLNAVGWLTDPGWATARSPAGEGAPLRLAISRERQISFWIRSVVFWPLATIVLGAVMAVVRRLMS